MILIADSGSTKTDWRYIDEKKNIHQFKTSGLNPFFVDEVQIEEIIKSELKPENNIHTVDQIYFYGAGCTGANQYKRVHDGLQRVFPKAKIEVENDLLGACRSLCGNENGLVAILGTGSNSCYYENAKIREQVPSLGYILGDEGSGTYIGKKLLKSFFYNELPAEVAGRFVQQFHLTKEDVLERVYRKPFPNRFLASFSEFVFQNRKNEFMIKIVAESFSDFFDHHICKYASAENATLHCTGSVAFNFNELLRTTAKEKNVQIGKITESPIAGLTLYHLNET